MENTRKLKGHVPFGYKKEKKELIPIEEELKVLDEIKELVSNKVISLREGSSWIEYKTGRKLSYQGLKNIIDNERLGN
jgi:hypothetical protein